MNLKKHFALLTLLFFSVVLSAQVKEKMITISFSKIPLSEAMARIEKTSGYTFFYDATQVNVKQAVSLNVKRVPVSKAVEEMLKGIDLSFEVTSTQIALFPKKSSPAQTGKTTTIIGKVVDENGEPIIGANVWSAKIFPFTVRQTFLFLGPAGSKQTIPCDSNLRSAELIVCLLTPDIRQISLSIQQPSLLYRQ